MRLTDHLQEGGGYQVTLPISDFIQPIVPRGQSCYDYFIDGAVPAQRDDSPVANVVVYYMTVVNQPHGATRGLGVKRPKGGFVGMPGGCKNEMGIMDREKQGQG